MAPFAARFQDVESKLGGYKIPKNVRKGYIESYYNKTNRLFIYDPKRTNGHVRPAKIRSDCAFMQSDQNLHWPHFG